MLSTRTIRCHELQSFKWRCLARCSFSSQRPVFFELTQFEVQPSRLRSFLAQSEAAYGLQKRVFPSWLGTWSVDVGQSLGRVYSLRGWADYAERDAALAASILDSEWQQFVDSYEPSLVSSASSIFVEATDTLNEAGLQGLSKCILPPLEDGVQSALEMRTYQLQLGYTTVPKFLELYGVGLKDKLAADQTGQSTLISLLYSEAGAAPLNTVVELWYHRSLHGGQVSRAASRSAPEWKKAIGEIAKLAITFNSQVLRAVGPSPLR
eukprot:gnl/MRDRNA2_/MRDRNA2_121125_c0_seq1.p1 gnl/MRDRNA2_/MRDRNA2_121125_c0~~gnl/MRDRNA2_/MRDRNA2_121125_c0_seq1.p1  ORF type:complete len:265 (+),score=42.92 gnl/MRDRNA2_/MRDRNA2_121125_c0_seq1:71-865(+)